MDIDVTLYPPLQKNRFHRAAVTLGNTATVDTLLEHLAIAQYEVGSVYVNGDSTTFNHLLSDGDRIVLLPLIGGG